MTTSDSEFQRLATPIAIVGLSAIFAKAANLSEYWDNIVRKIDAITDVPASRWNIEDYFSPDPNQSDKTYCKRGGFIPDISFDPMEFGLPPNILELTDVSQLLTLVVAKQALEDAGYGSASETIRQRTGVILGIGGGQKLITPLTSRLQYPIWEKVLRSLGLSEEMVQAATERMKLAYIPWEENSFPGMLGNVISGRVANRLDLGGINCVVDAACASSLSALQMAVGELTSGRTDMMLTGGVDTDNSIFMYMSFSKTPAFSRKNEIKPFDAESDGMMIGEGLGILVLKRLADAERDGDRIYAVIKGLGASSDGRYKSIYAPSSAGQALALERAYESAGFAPATVGLIEAHGTGTVAGDLCEVTTLNQVFRQNNPQRQHIALGSVKSQIGHTKAAAGAASMIKIALALHHKILPPTINIQQPHPQLDFENSPFYLNTETRPWIRREYPRRAGVSAFGFGGTNFHVVLEEYEPEQRTPYRLHRHAQIVVLHAPTPEALRVRTLELNTQLQSVEANQHYAQAVEASTGSIPSAEARLGFVANSIVEAREQLTLAAEQLHTKSGETAWLHPKGIFYRRHALTGKVVALFSGQGAQHVEMGRELLLNFPVLREAYHKIDKLFSEDGKIPVSQVVYPSPTGGATDPERLASQTASLQRTDYAQPAIGAMSAGLYQMFIEAGFRADFVAGHSFGELTALWAAGVLDEPTYFRLMKARGASMAPPAHPGFDAGSMLAVTGTYAQLQSELQHLPGVYLANWNSHSQVVLAGPTSAIQAAEVTLTEKGYSVSRLPVAAAFHTPLVGHAQQPFAEAIHAAKFHSPYLPVYANATAQPYPSDPRAIQEQLAQHLLQPVLFTQQIEHLYAAGGTLFIEFGPRNILTNLVKNILADRPHVAVALNVGKQKDSDRQLR
ncbi:MAG: beta-ketoacyl synthase N-terminal-like domain-containing protein, partial [Chloroflexota bacterium]